MNKDTGKPTPPQLQLYDKLVQLVEQAGWLKSEAKDT